MATYQQIIDFVSKKHKRKMQNCWIAHAKEIYKLPRKTAHNRKSINIRVKPCPDKELKWIEEAFRYFDMIN